MAVIMDIKTKEKGGEQVGRTLASCIFFFFLVISIFNFPIDLYLLLSSFFLSPFLVHLPFCFDFHVMSILLLLVFFFSFSFFFLFFS